jgi:hypothetical protein
MQDAATRSNTKTHTNLLFVFLFLETATMRKGSVVRLTTASYAHKKPREQLVSVHSASGCFLLKSIFL